MLTGTIHVSLRNLKPSSGTHVQLQRRAARCLDEGYFLSSEPIGFSQGCFLRFKTHWARVNPSTGPLGSHPSLTFYANAYIHVQDV